MAPDLKANYGCQLKMCAKWLCWVMVKGEIQFPWNFIVHINNFHLTGVLYRLCGRVDSKWSFECKQNSLKAFWNLTWEFHMRVSANFNDLRKKHLNDFATKSLSSFACTYEVHNGFWYKYLWNVNVKSGSKILQTIFIRARTKNYYFGFYGRFTAILFLHRIFFVY